MVINQQAILVPEFDRSSSWDPNPRIQWSCVLLVFSLVFYCLWSHFWDTKFYRLNTLRRRRTEYQYDAFVAYVLYCEEAVFDRSIVVNVVRPLLEANGSRLFIHGRDDIPAHNRYEKIYRGVTSCEKAIILVSPSLLRYQMCDFALQVITHEIAPENILLLWYNTLHISQVTSHPLKTYLVSNFIRKSNVVQFDPALIHRHVKGERQKESWYGLPLKIDRLKDAQVLLQVNVRAILHWDVWVI